MGNWSCSSIRRLKAEMRLPHEARWLIFSSNEWPTSNGDVQSWNEFDVKLRPSIVTIILVFYSLATSDSRWICSFQCHGRERLGQNDARTNRHHSPLLSKPSTIDNEELYRFNLSRQTSAKVISELLIDGNGDEKGVRFFGSRSWRDGSGDCYRLFTSCKCKNHDDDFS